MVRTDAREQKLDAFYDVASTPRLKDSEMYVLIGCLALYFVLCLFIQFVFYFGYCHWCFVV